MSAAERAARLNLEPAAIVYGDGPSPLFFPASEAETERSKAISLKRIADAQERIADAIIGNDQNQGIATTLFYMEQRLGPQS